jgi:hypothetical protein
MNMENFTTAIGKRQRLCWGAGTQNDFAVLDMPFHST